MSTLTTARRYAEALYEVVRPEKRQDILEEFNQAVTVLYTPGIRRFFFHPKTPLVEKQRAVASMGLEETLKRFFYLVLEKNRESELQPVCQIFRELVYADAGISTAIVASAIPLPQPTLEEISQKLSTLTGGRTIRLETRIDERLIGGLVIEMDGKVIDGSLSAYLDRFRKSLQA